MPLKEWLTRKHERRKRQDKHKSEESILTDDPLSTLAYPSKKGTIKRVDQIYAVCRVNPIFSDDSDHIAVADHKDNASQISANSENQRDSVSSGFSEDVENQTPDNQSPEPDDGIESVDSQKGSSISTPSPKSGSPNSLAIEIIEDTKEPEDETYEEIGLPSAHDPRQCLEISKLEKERVAEEPTFHPKNLVDEIIQKKENLRKISPKATPLLDKRVISGIVSYSDDQRPGGSVRSVVCPEWKQSVATIRKMWNLENQNAQSTMSMELEVDSLEGIDESIFLAKSGPESAPVDSISPEGVQEQELEQIGQGDTPSSEGVSRDDNSSESEASISESAEGLPEASESSVSSSRTNKIGSEEYLCISEDEKIYIDCDNIDLRQFEMPIGLNLTKSPLSPDKSKNCSNFQNAEVPNMKQGTATNSGSENDAQRSSGERTKEASCDCDIKNSERRKVTFANDEHHSKFLTDEIFNGHHILAARGRFTNPLLLKSKLYSIKASLPGENSSEGQDVDTKIPTSLEHLNLDNKIKSIMIDELYSSYTFEVQGIDKVDEQELSKKKKKKKRKTICLLVAGISLLIGFVVAITLYLRVII